MEATIVQKLITTKPKAGFYIMDGTDKKRIEEIEGGEAIMDDASRYAIDDIKDKIVRYTAQINQKEFHVAYSDYGRINDGQVLEGYTIEMLRNAHDDDNIRITDIEIIDSFGMHDVRARTGAIIRTIPNNRFNAEYEIQLKYDRKLIKLKRNQFMLLDKVDKKHYFHPRCEACGS